MSAYLTLRYLILVFLVVHLFRGTISFGVHASQTQSDEEFLEKLFKVAEVLELDAQLSELESLYNSSNNREKYLVLPSLARLAVEVKDYVKAEQYADELLEYAVIYCCDWNHGNAIHDGNIVKGMISVKCGDIQDAAIKLAASSVANESPQLSTFGPDMMLARELLMLGHTNIVLDYLDNIRAIWSKGSDRIDRWVVKINNGERPSLEKW